MIVKVCCFVITRVKTTTNTMTAKMNTKRTMTKTSIIPRLGVMSRTLVIPGTLMGARAVISDLELKILGWRIPKMSRFPRMPRNLYLQQWL